MESTGQAILPSLDHILIADYERVYEPSDDTFLLCDALETERKIVLPTNHINAIEIGYMHCTSLI